MKLIYYSAFTVDGDFCIYFPILNVSVNMVTPALVYIESLSSFSDSFYVLVLLPFTRSPPTLSVVYSRKSAFISRIARTNNARKALSVPTCRVRSGRRGANMDWSGKGDSFWAYTVYIMALQ